jgi:hypothetical protein
MYNSLKIAFAVVALASLGAQARGHIDSPAPETSSVLSFRSTRLPDFRLPLLPMATTVRATTPQRPVQPTLQGMVGLGFVALIGVFGLRRKRQT